MIDKGCETKFLIEGAQLTDLLKQEDEKMEEFEVEIHPNGRKIVPGTKIRMNSDVPASALTLKNQFKKLNYSQFTPNTIKIR